MYKTSIMNFTVGILSLLALSDQAEAIKQDAGTAKLQNCHDKISANFQVTSVNDSSNDQFRKYVDEVCPSLDLRMPNGVKVSSCYHSGFFLVKNLRPVADKLITTDGEELTTAQDSYDTFVNDFCATYIDVLPKRTEFVEAIYEITDKATFNSECMLKLTSEKTLNTWYDPIDPMSSIISQEICDLNYKLFGTLREKQRTSLSEYVSFSYLSSLDLYLNAQMQEDYENCTNSEVVGDASEWATNFIKDGEAFKIWDSKSSMDFAAATGNVITTQCADSIMCAATGSCQACDGCSTGVARIYKQYQNYINKLFADMYKTHSEDMFDKLHQASLALEQK